MGTIKNMLLRVQSINLPMQVPIIIDNTNQSIIELNQRQLYNDSEDSNNEALRLYGSLSYALEKNKLNPLPGFGRPDLYLTGAFFKGFNVRVTNTSFFINSSDGKTSNLVKKYTEDIFGLTPDSKKEYAKTIVWEGIKSYIKDRSGLVFQ